ncbi:hypothetical protein CMI37_17235 [Candidatus Pacearchaeota archaeon]|nr:hypothetical protein [Candidatus Pacearchaeota archaeon]
MSRIRSMHIADPHYRDVLTSGAPWWGALDIRTAGPHAATNIAAAATEAESQSADYFANMGDIVHRSQNGNVQTAIAAAEDAVDSNFSSDAFHVLGNHECILDNSGNSFANYKAEVAMPAAATSWSTGLPANWPTNTAYYKDIKGVRIVALAPSDELPDDPARTAHRTFLSNEAFDTDLPIMVLSHYYLANTYTNPVNGEAYATDYAAIVTLMEAANVQVVLQAHMHVVTGYAPLYYKANGIQYFSLRGALLALVTGEDPGVAYSAYYMFDTIFNAVKNDSGKMEANVQVTGYLQGTSKSYDSFLVA